MGRPDRAGRRVEPARAGPGAGTGDRDWPPAQPPDLVRAARKHLTGRFARGVEALLWDSRGRPLADADAIAAVIRAAASGEVTDMDMAAALVCAQAVRLDADRLEYRLLRAARQAGLGFEKIAAVLDLPSAEAAERYCSRLRERAMLPVDPAGPADRVTDPAATGPPTSGRPAHPAARPGRADRALGRGRGDPTDLTAKYSMRTGYELPAEASEAGDDQAVDDEARYD